MNRRHRTSEAGLSALEVLLSIALLSFISLIVLIGARATSQAAAISTRVSQLDEVRAAFEAVTADLSDAGPAHGFCLDDPADADNQRINPNVAYTSCRSARAVPFQLQTMTTDQVCYFGRNPNAAIDAATHPDLVCVQVFAGTFQILRFAAVGDWTSPGWDTANPVTSSVLQGLTNDSRFRYFDAAGTEIAPVSSPPSGSILPLPTNPRLGEVALVELTIGFELGGTEGTETVESVFVAPLRAALFNAGD